MRAEFIAALQANQQAFEVELSPASLERLGDYYDLVQEHNPLLHLVAPCSAEEFATRHILESLTLLKHLPKNARFADVGPGGGLPSIPCLLARDDLSGVLIESKEKKARFLEEAVEILNLKSRAEVTNRQFAEVDLKNCTAVTCRALDRFSEKLPSLGKWAGGRTMLLFGGNNLAAELDRRKMRVDKYLLPLSEQRFLFVIRRPPR